MTPEMNTEDLRVCDKCKKKTDYRYPVLPKTRRFPDFELWCPMCTYREMMSRFFSCSTYGTYPDDLPPERNPLINPPDGEQDTSVKF